MAVSQTQQQKAARARIGNLTNPSTVWFWVGWVVGKEGQVGIVEDGDGNQQRGIVNGNIQPRRDAEVSFIPGQPIGSISLATVDSPTGGGGAAVQAERDITTGGVESPSLRHYTVVLNNDTRRRIDSLTIENRDSDDTLGTAGAGTLKIGGVAVTLGTTVLAVGERLAIEITSVGTGSLYWAVHFSRA